MIRRALLCIAAITAIAGMPASARAEFGIESGSLTAVALNRDGTLDLQASSHPYSFNLSFNLNKDAEGHSEGGEVRDLVVDLPPGMIGDPLAAPRCTRQDFEGGTPRCPAETQVGIVKDRKSVV